jgi:hypothetical protein
MDFDKLAREFIGYTQYPNKEDAFQMIKLSLNELYLQAQNDQLREQLKTQRAPK